MLIRKDGISIVATKEQENTINLALHFVRVMPLLKDLIKDRDDMRGDETQEEWEAFCSKYAEENRFPMHLFEKAEKALNSDEYQFYGKTLDLVEKSIDLVKGKIAYGDVYGKIIKDR